LTGLDDSKAIRELDSLGVLDTVEGFPTQIEEGWALGSSVIGLPDAAGLESILVLGMGGSAAAGDIIQAVTEARVPVPFLVAKGYGPLPEWVGRNTLTIAISYSGNTEETIAAFGDAHERGARAVAVSSGGRLAELAEDFGAVHVAVPSGMQPRAALGYLAMPLLSVLERMGLVPPFEADVTATLAHLTDLAGRCSVDTAAGSNPAKDLAAELHGGIPVIYGGRGIGAALARRFKCDINEYAKCPAFFNELPEMDHNEICAWSYPDPKSRYVGVLIRDDDDHPRVAARFDITRKVIHAAFADVIELRTEGEGVLGRVLSTLFVTQLTAIYMAVLRDVDPGPVEAVERLKGELAAMEGAIT
jgi:glucose/mannose-6-phosphate isomerase